MPPGRCGGAGFFGKNAVSLLLLLPIALPGIITGLALLTAFKAVNLEPGLLTIVVGHATFCVVVVFNNVIARFRRTSWSLVEASMDLGATGWQTFRYVVLPNLGSALLAGGMLAFALSFDEIIVTTFYCRTRTDASAVVVKSTGASARCAGHQRGRAVGDASDDCTHPGGPVANP